MKSLFLALTLLCTLAVSACTEQQHTAAHEHATGEAPATLLAVKFHADWCGSCKALKPLMAEARTKNALDGENVLFVTLDKTNELTNHQAELMAQTLGLGQLFSETPKTGFYLLINSQSKEVLGKLTKNETPEQLTQMIKDGIAAL